jgi:hypothetical protein
MKDLKERLEKLLSEAEDCERIAKIATKKSNRLRALAEQLKAEIAAARFRPQWPGYADLRLDDSRNPPRATRVKPPSLVFPSLAL